MFVLALESSTSAAKAMLYDSEAGPVDCTSARYDPAFCRDGRSGTDEVYRLTMETGRRVAKGRDVAAVALSGVWHSIAVCDSHMRPAGGTYAWNYLAPAPSCAAARADRALSSELYRRTGCMPHVTYMRDALRYLRENGLSLHDKRLPTQGGYNFFQMTGEFLETRNIMSGTGLLNLDALEYDPFALEYAGVRADQLGPLGTYRDTRPLNARAAEWLGVAPGIPVVPAHADGALNHVSAGGALRERMTLSVGTSGAIRMTVPKPVLPSGGGLWCYCGATDYISGAAVSSACNAIDWFRSTFLGGRLSFDELDAQGKIREDMPVFLPFLFGERNPGWQDDRPGEFLGLRAGHTLFDMYHALQLGILFNLRQCYELLCREAGTPDSILLSGGILNSPRWVRMAADTLGRPLLCAKNPDASAAGAAVLALNAAGAIESIRDCAGEMSRATEVCPDPEGSRLCDSLYRRYLGYYGR